MTLIGLLLGCSIAATLIFIVFYALALFGGIEEEFEKGIGRLFPWLVAADVILGTIVFIKELICNFL